MVSSTYLQDKVNYIEKESAQHGWKVLFVIGEIQRAQLDLLTLDNEIFFSWYIDHQPIKDPIIWVQKCIEKMKSKVKYNIDKYHINQSIKYLKKIYWLTDAQISEIEHTYERFSLID